MFKIYDEPESPNEGASQRHARMYDARFGACSAGSCRFWRIFRRITYCSFCPYIIYLLCGISTSGVVPYPYRRKVAMCSNFYPIWELHAFTSSLGLDSILKRVTKDYAMKRVFWGGANNAGKRFYSQVLESCGGELWSVGLIPDNPVTDTRVICCLYAKDSSQELMVPGVNLMKVLIRKGHLDHNKE